MPRLFPAGFICALFLAFGFSAPAQAIPLFAAQYGVTCEKCHTVIPHLNEFGSAFLSLGYRIPGVKPGPAFPISMKANLVSSSANQGDGPDGAGLPKNIVDEIELFTTGAIDSRSAYFVEQYAVDGGVPGLTRDAWVIDRLNPWEAKIPVNVQAGSFTLPLPVDPETFRETYQGYALYEQTAGANPFNFFDPKIGVRLAIGNPQRGLNAQFFAGPGHDRQSGLPSTGTDLMATVQQTLGPAQATLYTYQGTRPSIGAPDRFSRTGYGLVINPFGRLSSETVLQTGWDSNCGFGDLLGCSSSGGFEQVRYSFNTRLFALARYEGTDDAVSGLKRDGVVMMGYGLRENSRITLEDVIQHVPQTTHTMNLQLTIAR